MKEETSIYLNIGKTETLRTQYNVSLTLPSVWKKVEESLIQHNIDKRFCGTRWNSSTKCWEKYEEEEFDCYGERGAWNVLDMEALTEEQRSLLILIDGIRERVQNPLLNEESKS